MSEVGPGNERDGDRTDDDALADAILASYTSSIPIIRDPIVEEEPRETAPDTDAPGAAAPDTDARGATPPTTETPPADETTAAAAAQDDRGRVVQPEPSPEPTDAPADATHSAEEPPPSGAKSEPPHPAVPDLDVPGGPRVWDLDDEEPAPSRVWDLGDLPPSIPFEDPAPVTGSPSADVPREEAPTPEEPWTRLVEPVPIAPETEPPPPPADDVPSAWAPPVWEPERFSSPERLDPPEPQSGPEPIVEPSAFAAFADAGVDAEVLERMQSALSAEQAPIAEQPAAPPEGGGVRREPMPWFDLASAPPPDPSTGASGAVSEAPPAPTFPPPIPPALVEPPPSPPVVPALREDPPPTPRTEPSEPSEDRSSPPEDDPGPDGRADGVQDASGAAAPPTSELPTIASLPPGTVRTSPLPPVPAHPTVPAPTAAPAAGTGVVDAAAAAPAAEAGRPGDPPEQLPGVRPVERAGVEPTPRDQRAGRAGRLFWLWFAPNASVLALATGGVLFSSGMSLRQSIIAALLGVALSFLPLGVAALAARGSGQPALVTSRATFGVVGNIVPVVVALLSRVVVGGALIWIGGEATRIVLGRMSLPPASGLLGLGVIGILAVLLGVVGYGLLSRALFVLAALTAVLLVGLVALTAPRVSLSTALSVPDGPWILLVTGAVLVVSLVGLAWAQSGGDVARYQSRTGSGSGTVVAAAAGAALPALALLVWGALLAASSPSIARGLGTSPVDALLRLLPAWAALPFLGLVVVTCVAGAATASYSGGFALLASGIRMPRAGAALVSGVLVLAAGLGLTALGVGTRSVLADVLTTAAVPVAAWVGIVGGETLLRRRRLHTPSLLRRGGIYRDVRVVNLVALVAVTAVGWGFTTATLAGLTWQGYLLSALGLRTGDPIAQSDVGVLIALGLALLVPLVTAIGPVRRQEAVRAEAHRDGSPRAA